MFATLFFVFGLSSGNPILLAAAPSDEFVTGTLEAIPDAATYRRQQWEAARERPLEWAKPADARGVFLTAWSMNSKRITDATVERIQENGGNLLIFDVKGNAVYFRGSSPLVDELGLETKLFDLPAVVKKLHEKGIYAVARFDAISDPALTDVRPETMMRHPKTGAILSDGWIDPSHPLALEYNSHVLCEVAASGVDEINLDYIRYSTEDAAQLSVYSGKEKADKLEAFVRMARETIDRCGPGTKLGLSTFAILGWDFKANVKSLGQDVVRFAPYVDIISPMAYPISFSEGYDERTGFTGSRTYSLVRRTLEGYQELLGPQHAGKIRPWIQGFGGMTTGDIANQIRAVYDSGMCGYMVWNAGNEYAVSYAAMARQPAPERCGL